MRRGEGKKSRSVFGEERQGAALRIMEALSGVDEELLERTEAVGVIEEVSSLGTDEGMLESADVEGQRKGGPSSGTDEGMLESADVEGQRKGGSLSGTDEAMWESAGAGAERGRKARRHLWQYVRPWAAVLCLAVVGALGWSGYQLIRQADKSMYGGTGNDMALQVNDAGDGAEGAEAEEAMPQEAGQAEGGAESAAKEAGGVAGEAENGAGGLGAGNGMAHQADNVQEGEKRDEMVKDADRTGQENDGTSDGRVDTDGGCAIDRITEGSKMPDGVSGEEVEGEQVSSDMQAGVESSKEQVSGGDGVAGSGGCLPANQKKLTEKEAREQRELGQYLPEALPQGYVFEEASSSLGQEEANLRVTWTRGLDTIIWRVVKVEKAPETVDIDMPETYDLRLYEIPHAESVPQEYHQTVDNPVFAWEDLGLEVVESRMMSYNDIGDTDTPRGNFAVLFPDNVVVYFNGRGTAEEIWGLFEECSEKSLLQ